MKKLILGVSLGAFIVILFALSCKETDDTQTYDLSGRWAGIGWNDNGASDIYVDIVQDSGEVSGMLYAMDKMDTVPFFGTLTEDHFAGVTNSHCPADIAMDILNDGTKIEGHAVDRPGPDCGAMAELCMYKVLPPSENITGTWSGAFSGETSSGTMTMVLVQTGAVVTGIAYINGESGTDTNTVIGEVIGNALKATALTLTSRMLVMADFASDGGNGMYANNFGGEYGTFHITKSVGKR